MTARTETEIRQAERVAQSKRERGAAAPATATAADGTSNPAAAAAKGDPSAKAKSRQRFATFNSFVDAVGRYLHPSDREVWHVLFRFADAETNAAEVRLADIACRLGCHTRTVARSVKRLIKAGLVERLKRGTRQGGPSRYRIDPQPGLRVEPLRAAWQRRQPATTGKPAKPRQPVRRSSKGQFTT